MIRRIDNRKMGRGNHGWLRSVFHFSFADYYNPDNKNFGALRVLNDDLVDAGTGFGKHPHQNMEIISYVVDGALTHADSMGNERTLVRGDVQYMSAGTGVYHSEHNRGDETLRFLQIWIFPDKQGYDPNYGDRQFDWEDRVNKWLHVVSSTDGNAPINIHQDANIYVTELEAGQSLDFDLASGRQAYLVQIEGESEINGQTMTTRDALESVEESMTIHAKEKSHFLVLEMTKG